MARQEKRKYFVKFLVNSRNIVTMRKLTVGVRKGREKKHWSLLRSSSCGCDRRMWPFQPAAVEKWQCTVELTQSRISSCHPTKQKQFDLIQTTWFKIFWSWFPVKMHNTNICLKLYFSCRNGFCSCKKIKHHSLGMGLLFSCLLLLCVSSPNILVLPPNV